MAVPLRVAAGTARAATLRSGQRLWTRNVEGGQVADLLAFNAADLDEAFSTTHTRVAIGRLLPTTLGDPLRSNRRPLTITPDDTGRHDLLIPACDPWRYEYDFGVPGHRSCSDNFVEALAPWGIACPMDLNPISGYRVLDLEIEVE